MKNNKSKMFLIIFMGLALLLGTVSVGFTQVPQTVSYQGFLTDSGGAPVDTADGTIDVQFAIFDVLSGGLALWTSMQAVTVNQGVYSVTFSGLGGLPFDTQYYLQVAVDENISGTIELAEILTPRQPFTAVPYALNADRVDGQDASAFLTSETDPVYGASASSGITGGNISNWNAAFGWGNHSGVGYLMTETDPTVATSVKDGVSWAEVTAKPVGFNDNIDNEGVTVEADPVFGASASSGITAGNISDWNTVFSWGDHASSGYDSTDDSWTGLVNVYTLSGNVGVGTSTPNSRLSVGGSGLSSYAIYGTGSDRGVMGVFDAGTWASLGNNISGREYGVYARGDTAGIYAYSGSTTAVLAGTTYAGYFSYRVGIGNDTPATMLDVNGVITATGGNSTNWNTAYGWGDHSGVGYLMTEADPTVASSVKDGVSWAEVTAKPAGFNDNVDNEGLTVEADPVFGASAASGISVGNISDWTTAFSWGNHAGAGYDTTNDSWKGTGNITMTTGNVGIGTTSPSYKLDVRGGTSSYLGYFWNNNNTSGQYAYGLYANGNAFGTVTGQGYGGTFVAYGGSTSGGAYGTQNYASAYGTSPAYGVYSSATGGSTTGREWAFYGLGDGYFSGDVGIGTDTPSYKLDVRDGRSGYLANFYNDNNTSGQNALGIYASGDARGTLTGYAYGGSFFGYGGNTSGSAYGTRSYAIANGTSTAYGVYSSATGGSTTGAEYAFYGMGMIYISNLASIGTTNYLCSSSSTFGRIGRCSSASKFKESIVDLSLSGVETIERLRPVNFHWKESGKHDLGFVAEEVEAVDPILATYDEQGEVIGVKYSQLTALLTKAIQEQQKTFERQQKVITELLNKVETLEKQMKLKGSVAMADTTIN